MTREDREPRVWRAPLERLLDCTSIPDPEKEDRMRLHRLALAIIALMAPITVAQETYRKPPPQVVKVLEAPPLPLVSIDPARKNLLLVARETLPPIKDLAEPMWRLAGLRLNPRTSGPHGPRRFVGLTLERIPGGEEVRVALPPDVDLGMPQWSPDGAWFAFTITGASGLELWVGDTRTGAAHRVTTPPLNAVLGSPFLWMPDSRHVLARFVPAGRGDAPGAETVPAGPVVQESGGIAAPVRTYQDLLQNPQDEKRFDYLATSELALVDIESGAREVLGKPAVYALVAPSPSGESLLVSRYERPYSYSVPAAYFPERVEIWDRHGQLVREVARLPLREDIPIEGVATGPRAFEWQDNAADTLLWAEALDGGDPRKKVPHRDRLLSLAAPFTQAPQAVLETEYRYTGTRWMQRANQALVSEYDRDRRWTRTWLVNVTDAEASRRLLWDRSAQDRYKDAGDPVMRTSPAGRDLILVNEGAIYLSGRGASPEGDRPFLDRLDLADFSTKRLWRCQGESYESVVGLASDDGSAIITQFETRSDPPNYFMRSPGANASNQLTHFADPAPELRTIHKELVTYARDDGVKLSATLYLPPGLHADPEHPLKLPLIVWAYPLEYNDAGTAGQVTGSPFRYTQFSGISHLFLLTQGYAIMDGAAMPVVGDPETVNDTFIPQIVAGAKAAIDEAVRLGVADRNRVGVGGHSYGAFMTANLLAHCDLFRAGVARSGAYNRTLTPFGFQSERRSFWEAPTAYINLSPFTHADQIKEPLLLIHGELDNNPGTFPIQSERLFHAMKGLGKTVRLVLLPYESHGYQARESVMQTLAEMIDWFDRYVKNAPPPSGQ
jgi:dipeptidyl aminopeptidase/acylaminoacyl peptidase